MESNAVHTAGRYVSKEQEKPGRAGNTGGPARSQPKELKQKATSAEWLREYDEDERGKESNYLRRG